MSNTLGMTEKDLMESRKKKLEEIKNLGIDPYPAQSNRDHMAKEILDDAEKFISSGEKIVITGRILALRGHGKLVFADVVDESGKIQTVFKLDLLDDDFKLVPFLDLGDFIEVGGIVFITNAGEVSIQTESLKILTKALRPLPDVHYGFKDLEARYRERYVDLLVNPEVKKRFYVRSKIIQTIREYLLGKGFLEVDTPVLQPIAGGATAKPFVTHYNAYERDVYLRIAPELYHKRLIVGGFEKIFEFARCFRNEGVDATHNPEFTNLEFYWAYADYEKMMDLVEEIVRKIITAINNGDLNYEINGINIDFSKKFERKTFAEVTGGENSDEAFKKGLTQIIEPTFVTNHPTEMIPLAKKNAKDSSLVDTFQLVIGGLELTKAFSELNDPIDQRERFSGQMKLREKGDEEAQVIDEDFLKAIEYGMPPTSGCGIGIDRLVRVLTNSNTLREILFFPFMKPADKQESKVGKQKETKLVTVVLNDEAGLASWQKMNTVAHLNASFAARSTENLFVQDKIETKDGKKINLNIQNAIMIKEASSGREIVNLIESAREKGMEVCEFTREMLETTNDNKVIEDTGAKNLDDVEFLGVLIFGVRKEVESLTEKYQLAK